MQWRDNLGIAIILVLFLSSNLMFLAFYRDVWWDSSVYIGMGKYIFSFGESGLWEESRPLAFPLILGIGKLLNFDLVYFGRLVSITFAILVIYMVCLIGTKLFSKKVGLLASFFTAFSYTFLFFSPNILTEIPSMFFVLLAFYFFLSNKFFLTGLFSGLAVMTRLFQFFTLIGLGLVFLVYFSRKPNLAKRLIYLITGASLTILPYIIINYYLYGDVFLPLKVQAHLTKTTGWELYHGAGFYFLGLLKENFLIVFLLSLPLLFKKNYKFYSLILIPSIYLFIFSVVQHKEMRFMLAILPFIYLLLSYCIAEIYSKVYHKRLALAWFSAAILIWLVTSFTSLADAVSYQYKQDDEGFLYLQNYMKTNNGKVWITNPLYALYSDERIEGLLYFYSSENLIKFINENANNVDTVLFNNCDMNCPTMDLDSSCTESKKILENTLLKFNEIYRKETNSCKYQIFKKPIS